MVPVLRRLEVAVSCVGNHDLDYGEEQLRHLVSMSGFPWLMANVRHSDTHSLLAGSQESVIIDWHGRKIGIMGLVESEWFDTLNMVESATDVSNVAHKAGVLHVKRNNNMPPEWSTRSTKVRTAQ